MEESFRVRVDKVFGALSAPSSWTLSDEEIQKKEWSGDKETGSDSDDHLSPARKETGDEFRDIRSSIGLDCTLDFEEEEDEVDRVALGLEEEEEDSCDRVYMVDMDPGYGIDVDAHIEDSFDQRSKDPRANHCAARIRLMEDAPAPSQPLKPILKPVLKNRESHKSAKRVRFHQHSLDHSLPLGGDAEAVGKDDPTLPDYLRNPTSYTRYTLDDSSNDLDEASNRKACMDLFHLLNKKRDEAPQQPLTFTPRNKPSLVKEGPSHTKFVPLSVAATVARDDEDHFMETDDMDGETPRTHKPGRHYRMRTVLDSDTLT